MLIVQDSELECSWMAQPELQVHHDGGAGAGAEGERAARRPGDEGHHIGGRRGQRKFTDYSHTKNALAGCGMEEID